MDDGATISKFGKEYLYFSGKDWEEILPDVCSPVIGNNEDIPRQSESSQPDMCFRLDVALPSQVHV